MTPATAAHRLHDLRAELAEIRAAGGYGSASKGKEAFDRLVAEAERQGRSLTMLNTRSPDEVERFFAWTVPGPDGHVYWTGGMVFTRNDGRHRKPVRWWWAHSFTPLLPTDDLTNTCGDRKCINPEHFIKARSERRKWFTDEAMIGALQVTAMQLGHVPTLEEWKRLGKHPTRNVFYDRFGSWGNALIAAGLEPRRHEAGAR